MTEALVHYVNRNRWLVWLAQGWALGSPYGLPVADIMPGKHGEYSVMVSQNHCLPSLPWRTM